MCLLFYKFVHDVKVHGDIIDLQEGKCFKLPLHAIEDCLSLAPILMFALPLKPSSIQESLKKLAFTDLNCTRGTVDNYVLLDYRVWITKITFGL